MICYNQLPNNKGRDIMIKYYRLLDLLNRREIGKEEFRQRINISSATIAKLSKHEYVSMEVIDKICNELHCQHGDIMEHIPDNQADHKPE